ncbi:helix-turn-helix domain-containing protein [Proteus sp. FME41]|uniref:helix-turn-helix domain-containing protein n=1 Tax=Proteus sp. FME41 TaxID=2742608 RepID=UPI0018666516|nr:helix-turn-helix transcriptional regulator [Proteus sp. FME41]
MSHIYPASKIIGKKIAYYRTMNGLTLSELAEIIGISQQQQSRYERGINRVSLDRLYQYARAFDICLSQFFILDEEEKKEMKTKIIDNLGDKYAPYKH